jgi:hypothetical protein
VTTSNLLHQAHSQLKLQSYSQSWQRCSELEFGLKGLLELVKEMVLVSDLVMALAHQPQLRLNPEELDHCNYSAHLLFEF